MAIIQFNIPEENISLKDLANSVAVIMKELQWAVNGNLDVKNIRANTITADRMDVDELSAITANIGEVTSGIVTGALIRTAASGKRVELSSASNLIKAVNASGDDITINPDITGYPTMLFDSGGAFSAVYYDATGFNIVTNPFGSNPITINFQDIYLKSPSGYVHFNDWSHVKNTATGHTLQTDLNAIQSTADAAVAGLTGKADHGSTGATAAPDSHNHGFANGTQLLDADGVTVHTWVAYAGSAPHVHTI